MLSSCNCLQRLACPKVAYRVPGAPTADWVDIYNRLYRERIIFLGQEIDDELANQIIGVLLVCATSLSPVVQRCVYPSLRRSPILFWIQIAQYLTPKQ